MPFKFTKEDKRFFYARGGSGEFKIAKKGLSPSNRTRYAALCRGGAVKKMAEGGDVQAPGSAYGNVSGMRMPATGYQRDTN